MFQLTDTPINVKNAPFNAKGDGVYDDTAAIQGAIDCAAGKGGTVYCPSGTYLVSAPLHWTAADVFVHGEGGFKLLVSYNFQGAAIIQIGQATKALNPTYGGGLINVKVDLSNNLNPSLVGVQLIQTWFTHIQRLNITNALGLAQAQQTAFQICSGALEESPNLTNWAGNINVFDLQIAGSFKTAISHSSGCKNPIKAQVNGVNYFGGFAFGAGKDRIGSCGVRLETGDSTRVYGLALEDFETGCFVGTQNQGPLDFRMEDCTIPYKLDAGGLNATLASTSLAKNA